MVRECEREALGERGRQRRKKKANSGLAGAPPAKMAVEIAATRGEEKEREGEASGPHVRPLLAQF